MHFIISLMAQKSLSGKLVLRDSVTQWVARLTRNAGVVGSSHIKGTRCFLKQETLPLLLSTGWFQKRIRA